MKTNKQVFSIIILLISLVSAAQDKTIDSLNLAFKSAKHDTTKAKTLVALSENLYAINPDTVAPLCNRAIQLIEKYNASSDKNIKHAFLYIKASALNNLGFIYAQNDNQLKAIECYELSLKLSEKLNDNASIGLAYRNMSGSYKALGSSIKSVQSDFKSLEYYKKTDHKEGIANALNNIGFYYSETGNTVLSAEYYTKSSKIYEEIGDMRGVAASFNNLGNIYHNIGDIKKAIEYYQKSLEVCEKAKEKEGMTYALNNIALIFKSQKDYANALIYLNRCLKIKEELKEKEGIALTLTNIGDVYSDLGNKDKTLEYTKKGLKIREEIGDLGGMSQSYNNLGSFYLKELKNDKLALYYYEKCLFNSEKTGNKVAIISTLENIGFVYLERKNYSKAIEYASKGLKLAQEIGYPDQISTTALVLKKAYFNLNNHKKALEMFELYVKMQDSITNQEIRNSAIKNQLKYEYDKKAVSDSLKVAEEKKLTSVQLKQEKTTRFALFGGLILVLVFSIFIFNRFRITNKQKKIIELKEIETQKQNEIISEQKHIVEEKHKEITDSINYAERIQRSFLASKELLNDNLKKYFVFFQPKDVVSGDFYWANKLSNDTFALLTADSTGHGVPGAIMSLLNITSTEAAVKSGYTEPAQILNETRKTIIDRLKKDGSVEGGKDGMDASLICFDFKNNKFTYSAANNPVWVVRQNQLIELPYDKMPVGKHDRDSTSFSQRDFEIQKGDVVYTLTDGMPDQFGGSKGKKFMYKQLKELFISIASEEMEIQKEILSNKLNSWKGDFEQVDDICIIGVLI